MLIVGSLLLTSGCAGHVDGMLTELERLQQDVELTSVPFHPQVTDQCGPAALASILNDAGVAVDAESLKNRVYIPGREGSLQLELLATTRHYQRIPYVIDTDPGAIVAELRAGRPVLILQNLGANLLPRWHYAVVVGYLAEQRQFVLRSADRPRLLLDAKKLLRTWQRGNYWAFVALTPGELPANANAKRYLRSVAAMEATGEPRYAANAYRSAAGAWPDNTLAWLGLGNASYNDGDLMGARTAYRQVLEIDPEHSIAMNNLSQVYSELGCRDEAISMLDTALSIVDEDDRVHGHLLSTMEQLNHDKTASRCL